MPQHRRLCAFRATYKSRGLATGDPTEKAAPSRWAAEVRKRIADIVIQKIAPSVNKLWLFDQNGTEDMLLTARISPTILAVSCACDIRLQTSAHEHERPVMAIPRLHCSYAKNQTQWRLAGRDSGARIGARSYRRESRSVIVVLSQWMPLDSVWRRMEANGWAVVDINGAPAQAQDA
jgi:hypothetical protein